MNIKKLTIKEQLKQLKKNDRLIVQWSKTSTSARKGEPITMVRIWGINHLDEVIVRLKDNLYFSIDNFANGESVAEEVYLVQESDDENI